MSADIINAELQKMTNEVARLRGLVDTLRVDNKELHEKNDLLCSELQRWRQGASEIADIGTVTATATLVTATATTAATAAIVLTDDTKSSKKTKPKKPSEVVCADVLADGETVLCAPPVKKDLKDVDGLSFPQPIFAATFHKQQRHIGTKLVPWYFKITINGDEKYTASAQALTTRIGEHIKARGWSDRASDLTEGVSLLYVIRDGVQTKLNRL